MDGPIWANRVCTTRSPVPPSLLRLGVITPSTWRRACASPRLAEVISFSAYGRSLRARASVVVIFPCSKSAVARFASMCRW